MLMLGLLGDQTYTVRGVQSLFGLWTYTSAPDLILTYIINCGLSAKEKGSES